MGREDIARELVALAGKLVEGGSGLTPQHLREIMTEYQEAHEASVRIMEGAGIDFEVAEEKLDPIKKAIYKTFEAR